MVLRRRNQRLDDVDVLLSAVRQQLDLQAVVAETKRLALGHWLPEFGADALGERRMGAAGEDDNLAHSTKANGQIGDVTR